MGCVAVTGSRILVVEDDREINKLLTGALAREGFLAAGAYTGAEALQMFASGTYQLVVLDLMIPAPDGFAVLMEIRKKSDLPVLILSARKEEADKVAGLALGADDYLEKPFSVSEFAARVQAQLRRYLRYAPGRPDADTLACGELRINLRDCTVSVAGRKAELTAKEFGILRLLMENPRKVFTKAQLFQSIWGEDYLNDENTVMVHIHRLREKIEDDPAAPRRIRTVWGIGYKLECTA
jgi:DNA-binding response OmpR family regulator